MRQRMLQSLATGPEIAARVPARIMSIAPYLKEIGRGKEGARSLDRTQAHDLMGQVLDGRVTDLEVGAFAIAMRMKGETVAELAGFLEAVHARCIPLNAQRPFVVLPSYNGARKLPNLTALLALLLSQEGVPVLVHGPRQRAGLVTTSEIFHDLGLPVARDAGEIRDAWSRREPVFMATESLCPPLSRLLGARHVIGLRNSAHTLTRLLAPCTLGDPLRVVNYTHAEYGALLGQFLGETGADAMLIRGTEGEPVADPRRAPRQDIYLAGQLRRELCSAAHEGVLTELPVLPRSNDASTTALYIQSVVSGEKPAPVPVSRQVSRLVAAIAAIGQPAPREKTA